MHTIDVQENNTTVIIEKLRGREGRGFDTEERQGWMRTWLTPLWKSSSMTHKLTLT